MGCAAKAVEASGIGIGVEPERLDAADPGLRQLRDDEAFEIELPMARAAEREEALIGRAGVAETLFEAIVDLIGRARDRRADRRRDPLALCAKTDHRRDGRLQH